MAYIYPAPGVAAKQATLALEIDADGTNDSLSVGAMQDITVNASNDVFTWTQLDAVSKKNVATTSTNSIAINLVVDATTFFGTSGTGTGATASAAGIFGMSNQKDLVEFSLYLGDDDSATDTVTISGKGYVTGLAPTVSADSPVWVTPVTITVDGEYTVA